MKKKKINNRAGIKKTGRKQNKKKPQTIIIEKENNTKENVTFANWATLLNENPGLL